MHTQETLATSNERVKSFEHFLRREVARRVHSSSGRSAPGDPASDYYPVALTRRSLRPGAVFHDPYGHVLVVSAWVQPANDEPGILFAVDAQPDGTIGRRRFWRGSFLFPEDGAVQGAGFKRFRPIYRWRKEMLAMDSNKINKHKDYGDYSLTQWKIGKEAFYFTMDSLINPKPLSPEKALRATIDALAEQVRRRVLSVDTGEQWKRQNPGRVIAMPRGSEIFQTAGPWEDYSTPSRDLRLLIAIQTVIDLPGRIRSHPKRFRISKDTEPGKASEGVAQLIQREAETRRFSYTGSDGQPHELTVAEVINRRESLEMAYNPNDCPEIRWGAPEGSVEAGRCRDHAPVTQRLQMKSYRDWFRERRRPVR
jgi:hypothetical protein